MWNLKRGTNELIYKPEVESQMHRYRKQTHGYWGKGRGGVNWEIGIDMNLTHPP